MDFMGFLFKMLPSVQWVIVKAPFEDNITTEFCNMNWTSDDINWIISNGKYRGDSFLQKTYAMDYLTKKRIDNDDTIHQYYIENNHEAIISKVSSV